MAIEKSIKNPKYAEIFVFHTNATRQVWAGIVDETKKNR